MEYDPTVSPYECGLGWSVHLEKGDFQGRAALARDKEATRLRLTHLGWGEGADWDAAYQYFDGAWRTVVLPRFKHRFEQGPIDWNARPELPPVAESISVELTAKGN